MTAQARLKRSVQVAALACAMGGAAGPFPFVMPLGDASRTAVDVSALNPAPLDASRRLVIRGGRFIDGTGRRVRFVGVDVTAGSCFPPKDVAEAVAARMHKFGINCVRLHHMDAPWAVPNIFYVASDAYGRTTDRLDPKAMERLDWFVFQLKRHGIYVDVNLHVTRQFGAQDGFPDTDKIDDAGKVVGYFEPGMIARQKLYARQLLTHVNPHLGGRLVDDPVVAFVELTNEDSLLGSAGEATGLPPHYRGILFGGWNEFLQAKYGSTRGLVAAWNRDAKPLGDNLLVDSRNGNGTAGWDVERHDGAKAGLSVTGVAPGPESPPGKALRIARIGTDGTDWHLQLNRTALTLKEGQLYTLSFAARADAPRSLGVCVRLDVEPWSMLGLDTGAGLGTAWKRYAFSFVARGTQPGHCRISCVFGGSGTPWELANVSLCSGGGQVDLPAGQTLEARTVDLPGISASLPGADFAAYLIEVERRFSQGMRDFIREELKAKVPVLCSQASYGGLGGAWRESRLDLVDMHAYWQHPGFPRKPWDSRDYTIENTPMIRAEGGGTLKELAEYRVKDKPFTVSEYHHPAPSEWSAEAVLEVFTFAALQDWDGVFLFDYSGQDLDRTWIGSFFETASHPNYMAFLPAAARIFLAEGVKPLPAVETLFVP
jgi:hypothetical protein